MLEKLALPEIRELVEANDLATLSDVLNGWLPADLGGLIARLNPEQQVIVLGDPEALAQGRKRSSTWTWRPSDACSTSCRKPRPPPSSTTWPPTTARPCWRNCPRSWPIGSSPS